VAAPENILFSSSSSSLLGATASVSYFEIRLRVEERNSWPALASSNLGPTSSSEEDSSYGGCIALASMAFFTGLASLEESRDSDEEDSRRFLFPRVSDDEDDSDLESLSSLWPSSSLPDASSSFLPTASSMKCWIKGLS